MSFGKEQELHFRASTERLDQNMIEKRSQQSDEKEALPKKDSTDNKKNFGMMASFYSRQDSPHNLIAQQKAFLLLDSDSDTSAGLRQEAEQ
jgi:hypothetical protein